jgi:hypothetical protein
MSAQMALSTTMPAPRMAIVVAYQALTLSQSPETVSALSA